MCVHFLAEAGVALIFMCKMTLLETECFLPGQRSALYIGLMSRMHINSSSIFICCNGMV